MASSFNKFTRPGVTPDIGLLSQITNCLFRTKYFQSDFDKWEHLTRKCESLTKTSIPVSVLIALLLGKTEGRLLIHLQLNLAYSQTYETLKYFHFTCYFVSCVKATSQTQFRHAPMYYFVCFTMAAVHSSLKLDPLNRTYLRRSVNAPMHP